MLEQPHDELAQQLLGCRYEELTPVQRSVIDLIANEAPSSVDPQLKHDDRSFGDRLADHVAAIGGSGAARVVANNIHPMKVNQPEEITDLLAKLYTVDLSTATNILGTAWDDAATSPSLEGTADLAAAQVVALPKTLVAALPAFPGIAPGKVEGIAILDKSTIAVANDNDFDIGDFDADGNLITTGTQSQLKTIQLAAPLP